MTNGKYVTDFYNVKHHTNINPDVDFGSLNRTILESQKDVIQAGWNVNQFLQQGLDVKSVTVMNYKVSQAPRDNQVDRTHYVIQYDVKVEHDPIPIQAVIAIAEIVIIGIIVFAIVYTIVTLAPVFAKNPVLLGLLLLTVGAVAVAYIVKR